MNHYLKESDEAVWTGHERVWAGMQQFAPRRSKFWPGLKTGMAFSIALIAGFCVIVMIGSGFQK